MRKIVFSIIANQFVTWLANDESCIAILIDCETVI